MLETAQRTAKLKRKKRASASLGEAAADKTAPPHERFLEAFRWMLLTRTLEEKLVSLYRGGQITGGVYIGKGQEAVSVAWIYAEIKPLRIERRRFKQFLRKIVARHSTVRRNAEICDEEGAKRDPGRRPRSRIGTA